MQSSDAQLAAFPRVRPWILYARPWWTHAPAEILRRGSARFRDWSLLLAAVASLFTVAPWAQAELDLKKSELQRAATSADWAKDWAVEEGFSLEVDTQGYRYPTALAFVPNPGPDPKDPLYFVTELAGTIKVVTNDRTIYTFATGFLQKESSNSPLQGEHQYGLAGICLAPEHGYVFVTFAYQVGGALRNDVIRFDTASETFGLKPSAQRPFTEIFAAYPSGPSHQIGSCAVSDDMLYVSVGDGFNTHLGSQRLDTFQGKVIRMTLDGKPVADNPFYEDDDLRKAANYVWAYGLRNPFGINVVDDQVLVAENGIHSDRFLRVQRGRNYLWNGSDSSIAANADYVFLKSIGPVQMNYFQATSPAFPERFKDQFYLAMSVKEHRTAGIMRIPYSVEQGRMVGVPEYMVRAARDGVRPVTGVAFGPDGLYFVPLLPTAEGAGAVLKVKHDPTHAHALTLQSMNAFNVATADPKRIQGLMQRLGCLGCHRLAGSPLGGTFGPVLGGDAMIQRIQQRVSSAEFLQSLQALNARADNSSSFQSQAREAVLQAQGSKRVRLYVKYQIMDPRFDDPMSAMPDLGLTEAEAEAITTYLLEDAGGSLMAKIKAKLANRVLNTEERRLTAALGAGIVLGLPIWFLLSWLMRLRRS
jgi:glucose/arabinose dehydrogenase/mono/diheme cytochrome c family protein